MDKAKTEDTETEIQSGKHCRVYEPITLDEALYMATIGGAEVLSLQDKIGNFKVGKEFDALLIDVAAVAGTGQVPIFDIFPCDSFQDILSKFIYLGDDRNIVKVFVSGNEVISHT